MDKPLLEERDRWVTRAAIMAAHTLSSTNGGYHPDTRVDGYDCPLDFSEMSFISAVHEYLDNKKIDIATETVERGLWLILEEYHDGSECPRIQAASLPMFDLDRTRELALELRDNIVKDNDFEPNEGRASFMMGTEKPDDLWISASNEAGDTIVHRIIRLYELGEQKPWFPG